MSPADAAGIVVVVVVEVFEVVVVVGIVTAGVRVSCTLEGAAASALGTFPHGAAINNAKAIVDAVNRNPTVEECPNDGRFLLDCVCRRLNIAP